MRLATTTALVVALAAASACKSPTQISNSSVVGTAIGVAAVEIETPGALREWVLAGLQSRRVDHISDQLRYWVADETYRGRATFAAGLFEAAGVEALFLDRGGRTHLPFVKELHKNLVRNAHRELDALYSILDNLDARPFERALETAGSPIHADTVALVPEMAVHRQFLGSVVNYAELSHQPQPSPALASRVVSSMDQVRVTFARNGDVENFFLAAVFSAQALELAGAHEAAIEHWLASTDTTYWNEVSPDLQAIIGARIISYRQRVRDEISAELAAQWESKHATALARIDSLEGDLVRVSEGLRQAQLDASAKSSKSSSMRGDLSFLDVLSFAVDVITIRGLLRRGVVRGLR